MGKSDHRAEAILSSWLLLEALAPQSYKSSKDFATTNNREAVDLSKATILWLTKKEVNNQTNEAQIDLEIGKNKNEYKIFYQLVLGAVNLEGALKHIVKEFGDEEELSPVIGQKTALASILINEKGFVVDDSICISRFGYSLPLILARQFESLLSWTDFENIVKQKLAQILDCKDEDAKSIPVNEQAILNAFNYLVSACKLPLDIVEKPSFVIKIVVPQNSSKNPSMILLNSFFINDLDKAKNLARKGELPQSLAQYLGLNGSKSSINLLEDNKAMEEALAPKMMPLVRWPAPGGFPLVLLQQAAVNLSQNVLKDGGHVTPSDLKNGGHVTSSDLKDGGLLAVNGPPGTGKTTLLRDVIASVILDRATEMAKFDDPRDAFAETSVTFIGSSSDSIKAYRLDKCLKGHEILVVASNNKAVQNISHELPATKAIGRLANKLNYFKEISDELFKITNTTNENESDNKTWGLISAALGKFENKRDFINIFWADDGQALKQYLQTPMDPADQIENEDQDDEALDPAFILERSQAQWQAQKTKFLSLRAEIENEIAEYEKIRCHVAKQDEQARRKTILQELIDKNQHITTELKEIERQIQEIIANIAKNNAVKPSIFSRYLTPKVWQKWAEVDRKLNADLYNLNGKKNNRKKQYEQQNKEKQKIEELILNKHQNTLPLDAETDDKRMKIPKQIINETFFTQDHATINLTSPWLPDDLHKKRELLFAEAMNLHRAFISAAGEGIFSNLNIMINILKSGSPYPKDQQDLLPDLWSSLFLVVPVLSSTFASIGWMLRHVPANSIGWLLIDEAGQATPQAAVGAIMRSKRVIAVGDPLQIPPVTTLPTPIVKEILKIKKVDPSRWVAPIASVQTLVDHVSPYQASFAGAEEPRLVGIPLLVHRRCQDPMFSISNKIAYENKMVHPNSKIKDSEISDILGSSSWLDIMGTADTKWCKEEGEYVVKIFEDLAAASLIKPDIFVITPFRIIADELKERFNNDKELRNRLKITNQEWINNRIGTVHTFQGREADTVLIVLGAPNEEQKGARAWAAGTPNIFNVAVSRAKKNAYIIGSHAAWSQTGFASDVASMLPIKKVNRSS